MVFKVGDHRLPAPRRRAHRGDQRARSKDKYKYLVLKVARVISRCIVRQTPRSSACVTSTGQGGAGPGVRCSAPRAPKPASSRQYKANLEGFAFRDVDKVAGGPRPMAPARTFGLSTSEKRMLAKARQSWSAAHARRRDGTSAPGAARRGPQRPPPERHPRFQSGTVAVIIAHQPGINRPSERLRPTARRFLSSSGPSVPCSPRCVRTASCSRSTWRPRRPLFQFVEQPARLRAHRCARGGAVHADIGTDRPPRRRPAAGVPGPCRGRHGRGGRRSCGGRSRPTAVGHGEARRRRGVSSSAPGPRRPACCRTPQAFRRGASSSMLAKVLASTEPLEQQWSGPSRRSPR